MNKISFLTVYKWILVIGGILGLLAASILTIEKINIAANPNYVPSCSLSPIVACAPVIGSDQASAFGFPNPFVGIAGFAMVWTVGMVLFAGATKLKKWFWWCFQAGVTFGIIFCGWLMSQSLYAIGKLCLYCMAVWAITIVLFWTTTAYNARENNIRLPQTLQTIAVNHFGKGMALTFLLVIILILTRFSDYFYSLIG